MKSSRSTSTPLRVHAEKKKKKNNNSCSVAVVLRFSHSVSLVLQCIQRGAVIFALDVFLRASTDQMACQSGAPVARLKSMEQRQSNSLSVRGGKKRDDEMCVSETQPPYIIPEAWV